MRTCARECSRRFLRDDVRRKRTRRRGWGGGQKSARKTGQSKACRWATEQGAVICAARVPITAFFSSSRGLLTWPAPIGRRRGYLIGRTYLGRFSTFPPWQKAAEGRGWGRGDAVGSFGSRMFTQCSACQNDAVVCCADDMDWLQAASRSWPGRGGGIT